MKKTLKSAFLVFALVLTLFCGSFSASAAAIENNGYRGIYIDINSAPYRAMASVPTWGQYAYGPSGCAWFATSRTKELTGKNITTIYGGYKWYYEVYGSFGFTRGSEPRAKALACYANHVSVVEQVNGDTITISTGGYTDGNSGTGYTVISDISRYNLEKYTEQRGAFYGYVYLGVGGSWKTGQSKNNLGDDFYGRIVNTGMNKALQVQSDGNVVLATKSSSSNQYWHFTRNSDGTYRIISKYNSKSLDVSGGGSNQCANLATYGYHGGPAQKWGIYGSASNYFLSADCTDCVIDVCNADTADGTNIWLYSKNDSVAQKYTIEKVTAPTKPAVRISESGKQNIFSWNKDSNATAYDLKIYKDGKAYKTFNNVKAISLYGVCSYNVALPDGNYSASVTAKNPFYSASSASVSFSVSYNTAGSWSYSNSLPSGVTSSKYKIEYCNIYEKVAKTSPGSEWTKGAVVKTLYENSGSVYESALPLETSNTRVLADYYYYHFCGGSTGNNVNFTQSGGYNHYDGVGKTNVVEYSAHQDYDDGRYTYYVLKDRNGNNFYCSSGNTCDGSFGSHGARSCYWYKMYVYQNKVAVPYYKYTKTGAWTSAKDPAAASVKVRYKPKATATTKPSTALTKPGKVNGVKVTATTTNTISLKWNKVSGATGYGVYKYNSKTKKYDCIKTTSASVISAKLTGLTTGTTYKLYVRAIKAANGKTAYGNLSDSVTVSTKLAKGKITSLKSSKKRVAAIKWKKVGNATRYQLQYSTSKKFTKKTTKTVKTTKLTLKKLKSKKKYYVRVRAYKVVSGQKVYGAWSSVKSVKVK